MGKSGGCWIDVGKSGGDERVVVLFILQFQLLFQIPPLGTFPEDQKECDAVEEEVERQLVKQIKEHDREDRKDEFRLQIDRQLGLIRDLSCAELGKIHRSTNDDDILIYYLSRCSVARLLSLSCPS